MRLVLRDGSRQFLLLAREKRQTDRLSFGLSEAANTLIKGLDFSQNAECALNFADRPSAVDFLRPFTRDPMNLMAMRQVLAQEHSAHNKLDDRQMIEQLGALLLAGRVQVVAGVRITAGFIEISQSSPKAAAKAAAAAAAPKPEQPEPPPPKPPEPAPASELVLAQVAALKNAAQQGVALCEECEKAKKTPKPLAATQAQVLKEAAVLGSAFCEECEAAKAALAAGPAKAKVQTWVGINLIDMAGQPVPDLRYRVKLPDGSVREGVLDENGCAEFLDLEQDGGCQVSFPDLDQDAWEMLG